MSSKIQTKHFCSVKYSGWKCKQNGRPTFAAWNTTYVTSETFAFNNGVLITLYNPEAAILFASSTAKTVHVIICLVSPVIACLLKYKTCAIKTS